LIISLYIGTDYEYLDEYWVIFQDFLRPVDESDGIDSINIYSYADNGKYYTLIRPKDVKLNGWVSIYDYFDVLPYYECDENNMALLQTKLAEFYKIDKLPFFILKLLYNHGKTDKRDYITEYLDIRVMEITSSNCIMYTEPDKQVKIQLKKGDIITVLEGEKNLLKIEYDDEGKTGWIKRVDVK
jgi:hypothetical protein